MLPLKFLCAIALLHSVNAACAPGDKSIGDLCYWIANTAHNHRDALYVCHSNAMNLAVVNTPSQANFLAHYVWVQTNSFSFWIGLSRQSVSSKWQWDDGSALGWSNFDSGYLKSDLFVAESTVNGKWLTRNEQESLFFVCSYDANGRRQTTTPPPTTTPMVTTPESTTTTGTTQPPKLNITCLLMYDTQSAGISADAVATYQTYFNFAMNVGNKLAAASEFSGYLDNFGYSPPEDHQNYPSFIDFTSCAFPVDTTTDDIDLDLKDVDSSLETATWTPGVRDQTCLVFISAASEASYGGTTIQTTYPSFKTVVGALVGDVKTIPGLTNVVAASDLSDFSAQAVVDLLLKNFLRTEMKFSKE